MLHTQHREPSGQPAAAVAAKDCATVETVLQKTIHELQGVRQQLAHVTDTATAAKVLKRIEAQLKTQARELIDLHEHGLTHQHSITAKPTPLKWTHSPGSPKTLRSSADVTKQALLDNAVKNPQSAQARQLIAAAYGVAGPPLASSRSGLERDMLLAAAAMKTGLCAQHGMLLNRQQRYDPRAVITDIPDAEVHRGLYELVTRGLLPKTVDATAVFEGDVLAMTGAMLHKRTAVAPHMPATAADMLLLSAAPTPILYHNQDVPHLPPVNCTSSLNSVLSMASSDTQALAGRAPYSLPFSPSCSTEPTQGPSPAAHSEIYSPQPQPEFPSLEAARQYEELMDSHSLHEFIIRYGHTLSSTPEFASYGRVYAPLWPIIAQLILQLEGVCTEYAVPLVVVDGKQLAKVAKGSVGAGEAPPMEELLGCVRNIRQVAMLLQQAGRRFKGPYGHHAAAVCIQAHWRGYITRRRLRRDPQLDAAAAHIQGVWRRHQGRKSGLLRIRKMQQTRDARFLQLQESLIRNWTSIHERKHVVIHLPSLGFSEGQRQGLSKPQVRENSQMARLCDLADPLVEVLYVAPFALPEEVDLYWRKLLEVCAVDRLAVRCRKVVPENFARLPAHMSLASKLLSSPRALARIQLYCKNRPGYIVPGVLGGEEVDLAVKLGLPLLAPHPSIGRHFSLKSGAKQLFRSAKVNVPPGLEVDPRPPGPHHTWGAVSRGHEQRGVPLTEGGLRYAIHPVTGQLLTSEVQCISPDTGATPHRPHREDRSIIKSLAQLIVQHGHVQRWLMKIDDEHLGRGHAYLDVAALPAIATALQIHAATCTPTETAGDPEQVTAAKEALELCIYQVSQQLMRSIHKVAVVAGPEAFASWPAYAAAFTARGGVIEACASGVIGSPSVNLFIDPLGGVRPISSHEQMFCPPYRAIGSSFPQASVPSVPLTQAALAVGRACYNAKIIGHVEVDFVASRDAGKLRLWAVDLSISPTASLSGFQLFDFLAAGQFDPATGTYWVPGMPETPDLQHSEAAYALDSQLQAGQSILQPFEQDAAAVQAQSSGYQLPVQFAEGDSDDEAPEQSSTTGHRPLSAMGLDEQQAAEGRQDPAVGATLAASSNAATTCSMTHCQENDLDFGLAAAEGGCAANSGNNEEQSVAELASMSHPQTAEQLHADGSEVGAAVWRPPAGSAESAMVQHEVQLEPRFYAAIDLLFHSGMHKRRSAEFLQNCRVAGLGFDMMARQGLVLNFMDSMSSCSLGMQCAGPTPQLALQGLCKALSFMLAQFGETGLDGRSMQSIIDPNAENFRNIYATIRFLADRVTGTARGCDTRAVSS